MTVTVILVCKFASSCLVPRQPGAGMSHTFFPGMMMGCNDLPGSNPGCCAFSAAPASLALPARGTRSCGPNRHEKVQDKLGYVLSGSMPTFLVAHCDPHNSYALIRSCAVCQSLPLNRAHSTAMSIPNGIGAAAVGWCMGYTAWTCCCGCCAVGWSPGWLAW